MAESTERSTTFAQLWTIGRALLIALGAFALGNVAFALIMSLLLVGGIVIIGIPEREVLLSTFAVQGIGFIGFGLAYLSVTDRFDLLEIDRPGLREVGYVVGGIVGVLAGWQGLGLVFAQFGIEPAESTIIEQGIQNPSLLLVLVPLSILVVGPGEELLYRGIVQGSIKRAIGPVGAILIASAVFASIHVAGLSGSSVGILATLSTVFVLALVLGTIYELSENLLVPALVHGLFNASQFLLAYEQATGGLPWLG